MVSERWPAFSSKTCGIPRAAARAAALSPAGPEPTMAMRYEAVTWFPRERRADAPDLTLIKLRQRSQPHGGSSAKRIETAIGGDADSDRRGADRDRLGGDRADSFRAWAGAGQSGREGLAGSR